MKEVTDKELKSIQLDVLQEFHNFCIAHNLHYSLCAGTLIGAIRHKGYIPWDDDIDVMMPRADYEKFLRDYSSNDYTLYHHRTHKNYYIAYAKLSDNRTYVKEESVFDCDFGLNIDIFPLDFFPNTIEESQRWSDNLMFLKNLLSIKYIKWNTHRSLLKNIIVYSLKGLLFPVSTRWIVNRIDILAAKYKDINSGYVGNMTNGYCMKERNPIATGLIDVEFEGHIFKSINNYDIYLKGLFGDYMQLPPVEARVSHHGFTAYWKD